jgi:hypothetical protein
MTGTIVFSNESIQQVFNVVHNRKSHDQKPRVMEFTDMEKLRNKLKSFQYLLYSPDYLLVEFDGKIYNGTDPKVIQIIDDWIDEHYMHKECII